MYVPINYASTFLTAVMDYSSFSCFFLKLTLKRTLFNISNQEINYKEINTYLKLLTTRSNVSSLKGRDSSSATTLIVGTSDFTAFF